MMTRPFNTALATAWIVCGVILIGHFSSWFLLVIGSLSIAVGVAMLSSPPEA